MKKIIYLIAFFAVGLSYAQDYTPTIKSHLQQNLKSNGLKSQDVSELSISSKSFSKSMGIENVYVDQTYKGIKIFNSSSSFAVKNGVVLKSALSFTHDLASKVNSISPSLSADMAIRKAASALGIKSPAGLNLLETKGKHSFVYSNGDISLENIPVELVFQTLENGKLALAWDLSIYQKNAEHYYSVRIDASTGQLLDTHDWVVSCDFGEGHAAHIETASSNESVLVRQDNYTNTSSMAGVPSYKVLALPTESPNHGPHVMVTNPADPVASPFGWHDTNGVEGPEHTITRGNNVYAKEDRAGNNSSGYAPDGGPDLNFDFDFSLDTAPVNVMDAAIVNLFYMNNMMHDIWYKYGFDEESGNFQVNNYGKGGNQGDPVFADALDGSGTNNANFATPPDGNSPRMQMFLWDASGPAGKPLKINGGPLGGEYAGATSSFGDPLPAVADAITADLVLVLDGGTDPYDGCQVITNAAAINGKIAVVKRGDCEFGVKVLAAENAGAIAVIVVNNAPGAPTPMGPGAVGDAVTIPSIMISQTDGNNIITALIAGDTVNGSLHEAGPFQLDGDFDNGIVAHEYGHGISIRLTGGRFNVGCLQNQEQMGEGWSDWFGLMLTLKDSDVGADRRGIGTFVLGQPTTGKGIRRFPYSTDMSINPETYNSIKSAAVPHGVGAVWAGMLWEMTWDLIEEYGFDSDLQNGTGGNNIAMQLVIDGLKLQGCSPGFVDGRDAILEADEIANGGANKCLIWTAFAKRGLGLSATQGSSNNKSDGVEAFDVPADCTLGVNDNKSSSNFTIYPNPSNGEINIQTKVDAGAADISIMDMNGRKVFAQKVNLHTSASINASSLDAGVYIMKIAGNGYEQTTKLIIN